MDAGTNITICTDEILGLNLHPSVLPRETSFVHLFATQILKNFIIVMNLSFIVSLAYLFALYLLFVYLQVHTCHVGRSEDNLGEAVLFYHTGPSDAGHGV